jgi:hypothetical protein
MRLRLTAAYVAFTTVLLAAIGFAFRAHLKHETELNVRMAVDSDWGATVGYLHFDNQRPEWVYDRSDPDEAYTVERLRHVYSLANQSGVVLQNSTIFESIGLNTTSMHGPEYSIRRDEDGVSYMLRTGWIYDDQNRRYALSIGRSLAIPYRTADRFIEIYSLLSLAILFLTGIFSWWLTGVAIRPSRQAT